MTHMAGPLLKSGPAWDIQQRDSVKPTPTWNMAAVLMRLETNLQIVHHALTTVIRMKMEETFYGAIPGGFRYHEVTITFAAP